LRYKSIDTDNIQTETDPNIDSFEQEEKYIDYATARTQQSADPNFGGNNYTPYSPGQYSTGNILEQIENDSATKECYGNKVGGQFANTFTNYSNNNAPNMLSQTVEVNNHNSHFSVIEQKSTSFKDAIRQYIEKCRHLEFELNQKTHLISDMNVEASRTQDNMQKLRDELISSEKQNQILRDLKVTNEREINDLSQDNNQISQSLTAAKEDIKELSNILKSEKHFNDKVSSNLAHQTQETSKLKSVDSEHCSEISLLRNEIDHLKKIIDDKNDSLAKKQDEKMQDGKKYKDLKDKFESQVRQNDHQSEEVS
jgi:chromosome segregation ATPase